MLSKPTDRKFLLRMLKGQRDARKWMEGREINADNRRAGARGGDGMEFRPAGQDNRPQGDGLPRRQPEGMSSAKSTGSERININ
jgi:hypothetical protein